MRSSSMPHRGLLSGHMHSQKPEHLRTTKGPPCDKMLSGESGVGQPEVCSCLRTYASEPPVEGQDFGV